MRVATARAAMRRGCVCPMRPRSPRPMARQIFGSCVVLPEPVAPQTMTTWCARIARGDLVGALRDRQLGGIRNAPDAAPRAAARLSCERAIAAAIRSHSAGARAGLPRALDAAPRAGAHRR